MLRVLRGSDPGLTNHLDPNNDQLNGPDPQLLALANQDRAPNLLSIAGAALRGVGVAGAAAVRVARSAAQNLVPPGVPPLPPSPPRPAGAHIDSSSSDSDSSSSTMPYVSRLKYDGTNSREELDDFCSEILYSAQEVDRKSVV